MARAPRPVGQITEFSGKWRFLSNFFPVQVPLDNVWYPSVEHAYQSAKTLDLQEKTAILQASSPGDAKRLGKKVTMRPDWDTVKLDYMKYLVWYKFGMHPDLGKRLLETGNMEIIEGNTWGDVFWGVCNGKGENHLGRILMAIRDQVERNGVADTPPTMPALGTTPLDKQYSLESGKVFVFGSNLAGVHGAGAAAFAKDHLGALEGYGYGPLPNVVTPRCYAIPTKDQKIQTMPVEHIKPFVDQFIMFAWERTDLQFFVTRIGCGLAGYTDADIKPLFADAPPNCELPHGWGGE
jgi:ribA/ribD-fused uncharacterized protein